MSAAAAHADWRIVAPWYRWERADGLEPERGPDADRPALHKYASTAFVADFLRDPQRSVRFDESVDVSQDVTRIPAAELTASDGRLRSLSLTRLCPSTTRKLFLPAHQRFYLVAVGLHCDRPGFPRVAPAAVEEVGLVVRRQRTAVPPRHRARGAALVRELTSAQALATARAEFDAARDRSRALHPFTAARRDGAARAGAATLAAVQRVELARRRLRAWADAVGVESRTEAWIPSGDGDLGAWLPTADDPGELVETWYPMRLLTPAPDDPDHAAHDGTIYYAVVPTAGAEVTATGESRFSASDTYEIRVFARPRCTPCPGPLVWSAPSRAFRVASFYDPAGSAQRPVEIRLPDLAELQASAAAPSVRMTTPPESVLEFSTTGDIPTTGRVAADGEVCFFSVPLITIVALFLLNLFLPIVVFVFQLWWLLTLRFCIPPSASFEADLATALKVAPSDLAATAELDVAVLPDVDQARLRDVLRAGFDPPAGAGLDPVPDRWKLGGRLTAAAANGPLVGLAVARGAGSATGGAPVFASGAGLTSRVRRDQVVHP